MGAAMDRFTPPRKTAAVERRRRFVEGRARRERARA